VQPLATANSAEEYWIRSQDQTQYYIFTRVKAEPTRNPDAQPAVFEHRYTRDALSPAFPKIYEFTYDPKDPEHRLKSVVRVDRTDCVNRQCEMTINLQEDQGTIRLYDRGIVGLKLDRQQFGKRDVGWYLKEVTLPKGAKHTIEYVKGRGGMIRSLQTPGGRMTWRFDGRGGLTGYERTDKSGTENIDLKVRPMP
jgi:hypothetical protein